MSGCYDRRGDERTDQYRCDPDPDGTIKACCNAGNSCATNGLCISNEESITPYYIHGCTVQDWDVDSCPGQCYNSTGNGIQPCGNGTFCCYGQVGCDCENEDEVFSMGSVRVFTSIPLDATHETSTLSETTSTPSTTSATSTTLVSTTTSTVNTSTTTTTTKALPAESTQSGDLGQDSSGGSSINLGTGLGIGLGVGVPLGLIAMSIVWFMRRRHSASATTSTTSTGRRSNDGASSGKPYVEDVETTTEISPHPSTLSKHHSFTEYFSPKEQSLSPLSPLPPSEAPVRTYAEMDGTHYRREMDPTTTQRYELYP